jgi:hypothetical protein
VPASLNQAFFWLSSSGKQRIHQVLMKTVEVVGEERKTALEGLALRWPVSDNLTQLESCFGAGLYGGDGQMLF